MYGWLSYLEFAQSIQQLFLLVLDVCLSCVHEG